MVGFVSEAVNEVEGGVVNQLKCKTSDDSERLGVNFEGYLTDLDCFSLGSLEPLVEFDSIKDWIEEMEVPDSAECNRSEIGNGLNEGSHLQNSIGEPVANAECNRSEIGNGLSEGSLIGKSVAQDMDHQEKVRPVKLEQCGTDDHVVEDRDEIVGTVKSIEIKESSSVVNGVVEIVESDGINKSCMTYSSIEEGLEKVSLVGEKKCLVADRSHVKQMDSRVVTDGTDSDSNSESQSESEDSSSSSSDSSDSDSDDDKKVVKEKSCKTNSKNVEHKVDVEEGEIMDVDADKMVSWTDDSDDDIEEDIADASPEESELGDDIADDEGECLPKGPIRSKNELKDLPPVAPVNVSLEPSHQILPVGVVLSVLGTQVIVEGSEKHNPLSEGSIVWITESRLPLGIVDEIFGPVKTPYYIVRFNSESEVPSDIQSGTAVGFVSEFVGHVLNDRSLYKKGYDASGENDEEVFDEAEFSDDEKEAEYRRMLKASKRGNNSEGQGPGNKRKNKNNAKNREKTWTRNQPAASQSPTVQSSQPTQMQQNWRAPSPSFSQGSQPGTSSGGQIFAGGLAGQGNQSGSSTPMPGPGFPGGPPVFPQMPSPAALLMNGNWTNGMPPQQQNMAVSGGFQMNGMPPQQQNMAVSGGFQMNGMPWMQQNHPQPMQMPSTAPQWQQQQQISQFPLGNPGPPQQPFDLSRLLTGNNGSPFGPMNFVTPAMNSQWPGMLGQNLSIQAPFYPGLQNPNAQMPMFSGFMPNGPQPAGPAGQNSNSLPGTGFPVNEGNPQFRPGFSSGRGRGRKPFQGRGGHFGGGRGRQQSK